MKIAYVYQANELSQRANAARPAEGDVRLDWRLTCANFTRELTEDIEALIASTAQQAYIVVEDADVSDHFAPGVSVVYEPEDFFDGVVASPKAMTHNITTVVDAVLAQPERWAAWREKPRFVCFYCRKPIAYGSKHFATDGPINQWYPDRAELAQVHLHEECRAGFALRVAPHGGKS